MGADCAHREVHGVGCPGGTGGNRTDRPGRHRRDSDRACQVAPGGSGSGIPVAPGAQGGGRPARCMCSGVPAAPRATGSRVPVAPAGAGARVSEGHCGRNCRCHRRESEVPVEGTGRCALCGTAPWGYPVAPGGTESGVPRGAGRCTGSGVPVAPGGTGSGVPVAPGRAGARTPGRSWQSERSRLRRSREEPDTTHSSVRSCAGPGAATWAMGDRAGSPITAPQPGPAACAGKPREKLGIAGGRVPHSGHPPGIPEQSGHGTGVGSSWAGRSMRAAPGTRHCEPGCAGSVRTWQWRQGCAGKPPTAHAGLAAAATALPGSRCRQGCGQRYPPPVPPAALARPWTGARCQRLPPARAGSSLRAGHRQLPALPNEESANRARPWAAWRLLRESVPSSWGNRAEGTPNAVSEWVRAKASE